ncbi:lipopolysaccharide assembly protein LapB [Endozoicomonas sp. ISHI1]|uniref:tetratricopeptide repeat protein n=2 Tax=Endozoicomonas TaxID=305899 RepID=UPI00214741B7|nr:hypothetical protein [Endozoicomonas sp. ISHI1]
MSYGLPPACGSTSQPSQHRLPDVNQDTHQDVARASKLNPYARPFVPRGSSGDDDRSSARSSAMPPTIHDRRTTAYRASSSQRPHPLRNRQSPEAANEKIDQAYKALKNQHFSHAEEKFQAILNEYRGQLSQIDYQRTVIGLARSLKEQNREKQKKACYRLEKLRLKGPLTALGASRITNLDLTLSHCEQALGLLPAAEKRLLILRNIKPGADEEILCQTSHNFDADMSNARLWQSMEKHQMTETLLVNVKTELTRKLQSNRSTATAETLHKHLHIVNIALVRLLQERGLYEWAENLLLNISGKPSNGSDEFLCKPCGDNEIDLALARLWQLMEKNERAEKLLLNMSGKPPNASEEILCTHSGNREIDLALVRLWQTKGKHEWSEKLLLDMTGKHPGASEEILCRPFGRLDIDMTLVRHWEIMGKYHLVGRLLLNMSNKHPSDSEESLCLPCGVYEIDLAMVRYWEDVGQYNTAEKLLLNMMGKQPNQNIEILCQSCRDHQLDLALARLWHMMEKYEWAERLLLSASDKDPNDNAERLCKPCGNKHIDLALIRNWEIQGKYILAERLLLNMVGKSPFASMETLCKPYGDSTIDLTLVRHWDVVGEYKRSEKLLLNMSDKHPKDPEELLCKPCGQPLVDIALMRTWESMGEYKRSEKLLLNMIGKHPDNDEEDLCKPSGNHDLDLALGRLWEIMNKTERAQRLIHRCCDLYHTSECELALLNSYAGTARFMEMITGYQESANILLSNSIHYFRLASQQIADNDPGSGQSNLKKALEYAESVLEKHPGNAGACSQKAHCLRMMNDRKEVWSEWFKKANALDPGRLGKFKANDIWRIIEARAVQKVKDLA